MPNVIKYIFNIFDPMQTQPAGNSNCPASRYHSELLVISDKCLIS